MGVACLTAAPATAATTAPAVAEPAPRRLAVLTDPRISESSGLVASPTHRDLVWSVDDSGSSARVIGVSPTSGRTVAVLSLAGTQARDWEAMTAARAPDGRGLLWVGDVGDNRGVRDSVVLRLVTEPRSVASATVRPVSLRVRYPDGAHDVETLLRTPDGRLLLVSKRLFSGVVYQVPPAAVAAAVAGRSTTEPVTATVVGTVAQSLVTDGAALPDGRLVLRGYDGAVVYAAPVPGRPLRALFDVTLPPQPQGETLAVVEGGAAALVGSEGRDQPLWRVALPPAAPDPPAVPGPAGTSSASTTPAAGPAATSGTGDGTSSLPIRALEPPRLGLPLLALAAAVGVGLVVVVRRRDARAGRR